MMLSCNHYHIQQMTLFTQQFHKHFMCQLSQPKIPTYSKPIAPVYAYNAQALYNAILAEFRAYGKYSYCFKPVSDIVGDAMNEEVPNSNVLIISAEYRKIGDSFATAMVEACSWFAGRMSTYILLPKDFTPPASWINAAKLQH